MKFRLAPSLTAAAVLMLSLVTTARPAAAAIITFEITGSFDTGGQDIFGVNGVVPCSFSFTYDTSLGAQLAFVPNGSGVSQDYYGYSAAGIVASNLTFGSGTWAPADIVPTDVNGHVADFWVDKDFTVQTPTFIWIGFENSLGNLYFGKPYHGYTLPVAEVCDVKGGCVESGDFTVTTSTMTPVPEPASLLFLGSGLLGFVARSRLSKKASHSEE